MKQSAPCWFCESVFESNQDLIEMLYAMQMPDLVPECVAYVCKRLAEPVGRQTKEYLEDFLATLHRQCKVDKDGNTLCKNKCWKQVRGRLALIRYSI